MKIIHAILIDPATNSIKVVQIDPTDQLGSAYKLIGCELIEAAYRFPNGDVIYVDEEGLIAPKGVGTFQFQNMVFQGRGLIVNEVLISEDDGWSAPRSPFIELVSSISFPQDQGPPKFDVARILADIVNGSFRPMTSNDYDAFADCLPGSLIQWDMDGWTVLVCPGDSERDGCISVHAYKFSSSDEPSTDSAWMLLRTGWEAI